MFPVFLSVFVRKGKRTKGMRNAFFAVRRSGSDVGFVIWAHSLIAMTCERGTAARAKLRTQGRLCPKPDLPKC